MADTESAVVFGQSMRPYRWLVAALPAAAVLVGVGIWQLFEGRTGNGAALILVPFIALTVIVWATVAVVRRGSTRSES